MEIKISISTSKFRKNRNVDEIILQFCQNFDFVESKKKWAFVETLLPGQFLKRIIENWVNFQKLELVYLYIYFRTALIVIFYSEPECIILVESEPDSGS
jgi:hypothetical protein